MSLQQRLTKYRDQHDRDERDNKGKQQAQRTIEIFPAQAWAIVDGELCEAQALVDEPNMSLCVLVSKPGVGSVPVPVTEATIFRNMTQEAVQQLIETGASSTRNR